MPQSAVQLYIVDDEPSICTAYSRLARSANISPRAFPSVEAFMAADCPDENACVICDLRMSGRSGLDLPNLLLSAGRNLPVIFVTAHDTAQMRELAQNAGAAAFFRKPVDDQALLDAVAWALSSRPERKEPQ